MPRLRWQRASDVSIHLQKDLKRPCGLDQGSEVQQILSRIHVFMEKPFKADLLGSQMRRVGFKTLIYPLQEEVKCGTLL